ncbi:MAG: Helix-turn-helix domain protein [Pelotomaculum sp. PtaU1.Bin065]|nr:MAG: Helix-turn-helix domain protein [Pelotomaculum sp. PtaU1.Bin065]
MNSASPDILPRLAYSVEETAALLGVSTRTVYRMVENGSLPYKRLDGSGNKGRGKIIIPASALNKWLSVSDISRQEAMKAKSRQIAKEAVAKLRGGEKIAQKQQRNKGRQRQSGS